MSLLVEVGMFSFAVDSKGRFWKKLRNSLWTEFTNGKEPPRYYMPKIIATKNCHYWTKEYKNKTIIKRQVNIENQHHIKRSTEYDDFICARNRKKTGAKTAKNKPGIRQAYFSQKGSEETAI